MLKKSEHATFRKARAGRGRRRARAHSNHNSTYDKTFPESNSLEKNWIFIVYTRIQSCPNYVSKKLALSALCDKLVSTKEPISQKKGPPAMNRFCRLFSQLLQRFSRIEFQQAVKETKAERHARRLTCWGQFVAMLFCQVGRAHSLREIGGGLRGGECPSDLS